MPTLSRILVHLSRLKVAVQAANLVSYGCQAGMARQWVGFGAFGARCDVDRCHPATRARASGEERLVPTPPGYFFTFPG